MKIHKTTSDRIYFQITEGQRKIKRATIHELAVEFGIE